MTSTFIGVADGPVIALALLILKRARMTSLPVTNREQAINVIRGVMPAPSRKLPLNLPCIKTACCADCHRPLPVGTLCDSLGIRHLFCGV